MDQYPPASFLEHFDHVIATALLFGAAVARTNTGSNCMICTER